MELFIKNSYCSIKEDKSARKIEVNVGGKRYEVCITHMRMLQRRLNAINFDLFFYNTDAQYDTFKLRIPNYSVVHDLRVVEAIALKDAINEMFFLFDLQDTLTRNNVSFSSQHFEIF